MNLELFPCSGGMAEGFRRAGITFDLAIDYSVDACDSYEKNLGHRPVHMDVNDFARMVRAGWRSPSGVDLLVADPPCTPWSRAGKRQGIADERDCLRVTAELITLLRPRAYLIGNVPGLQDATQWHVVQEVIGGLVRHGYCVADYAQLDAADFGVPQHRIRPFWFGHMDGPCVRWPERTHGSPEECAHPVLPGVRQLQPWVTCREALGHLSLPGLGRTVRMRIREKGENDRRNGGDETRCSSPDRPARTVVAKPDRKGGQILLGNSKHPVNTLDAPSMAVTTKGDGRGAQGACALLVRDPDDTRKANYSAGDKPALTITRNTHSEGATLLARDRLEWPWNRPSTTVCSRDTIPPLGHHDTGSILSLPNAVILSERAAALLQGFPGGWLFSGKTKAARWAQIGMAMPPGLAAAVARGVAEQMTTTATRAG